MKFMLAKKINMSQIFGEDGAVTPGTLLSFSPMTVTAIKSKEKDGYSAVQFGFGKRKESNLSKPVRGHLKGLGSFAVLMENRLEDISQMKRGDVVSGDIFEVGDSIAVSALSKGKGFQGVVKRHGFHGGPRSHGQKHSEREPGSISGGTREGGRVPKGMRMAGRMGGDRITVKGLKVLAIDKENSVIMISGAIPGRRGTLVELRSTN
ncbi:MAG: 50S ribosomal protein L3 [Patescibacteria group bacterium]